GGGPAHERMLLNNMARSLFINKSITTTETKAKRLRPVAERLVTFAKRGDLHSRRRVMQSITDKNVVHELFVNIAPLVAERQGGYTRITKLGFRKGDNAPMAVVELVLDPLQAKKMNKKPKLENAVKAAPKAAAPAEEAVAETPAEEVAVETASPEAVVEAPAEAPAAEATEVVAEAPAAEEAPEAVAAAEEAPASEEESK
ncbi:MAG: 50S ribosomal protein L17, partial [Actinobacteria bacterium]|nr:50S ribosomal protein L17 [Actinomycetota bacterium]